MKKKIFTLSLLAIASVLTLSGCSFLDSLINDGGSSTPSDGGKGGSGGGDSKTSDLDTYSVKPSELRLENRITYYQVNDLFVMPTVYLANENGDETLVSNNVTASTKDNDHYDKTKKIDVDMSEVNVGGVRVYIRYSCVYKSGNTTSTYNFSNTYDIKIFDRRDSHYDPEDSEIKTLEISDVTTNFNEGDAFVKPLVYAIGNDNAKTNITDLCTFSGYDMNSYGYQNVTVTYNDHTLSYEIVVHNQEEEKLFPFMSSSHFRINYQKSLFVVGQRSKIYFISYNSDGTVEELGSDLDSYLENVTFISDNKEVIDIDDKGNFVAVAPGTAFVNVMLDDIPFRAKMIVEDKKPISINVNNYRSQYYTGHSINFGGDITVTYQNGYTENVVPEVDTSKVNTDVPGEYEIVLSYTINGITVSAKENISIVDSSLYTLDKTPMAHNVLEFNNNFIASALPTSGTVKNLVIPVKFTDSDKYITKYNNVREDIEKVFFGTNEDTGWRSVKTYYEEESLGKVTFTGKVAETYDDNHSSEYYYTGDHMQELKNAVINDYFNNHPTENRRDYDSNHDGYIDGINLIYLVPDAMTSGVGRATAGNLWAMVKTSSGFPDVENPVCCSYFWASYDFIYPTKAIAKERTGTEYAYYSNTTKTDLKLEARTFIHETGHMFGIDDYYSYSQDNVYFAGEINMQTSNYMGHDPYSLLLYNWAEPYIPEISTTITIGDFQNEHDVILLTPSWNSFDSPFDEYFLIDLFVPTSGLNAYDASHFTAKKAFNTIGVRIWHVDARLVTVASNYTSFTFDPTSEKVRRITDNSYGLCDNEHLEQYDRFMELQLVRNDKTYDYQTSGKVEESHYFKTGDKFDMNSFSSQFVNGNKMDNGLVLGWEVEVIGIYNSASGYTADIKLTRQ